VFQEEVANFPGIPGKSAGGNDSNITAKIIEILPSFGKHFRCFLRHMPFTIFVKVC